MSVPAEGTRVKKADELSVQDFEAFPIWFFKNADEETLDETAVRPVEALPAKIGGGFIVGSKIKLSNGTECWALLGNIDPENPRKTEHFMSLSVFKNGEKFHLARYHDFDATSHGPSALADFLGLPLNDIFPIRYDLRGICVGDPTVLAGRIEVEPREVLSKGDLIELAI